MLPNSIVMTVAAIFKSRLLKMAAYKKKSHIFVIKLKLQVRFAVTTYVYTLLMVWESKLFWKKKSGDEAEAVQYPFNEKQVKWKCKADRLTQWLLVLEFLKYIFHFFITVSIWIVIISKLTKINKIEKLKKYPLRLGFACFSQWHSAQFCLILP